jgi:predicted homoserine dehydrogenase-like protein
MMREEQGMSSQQIVRVAFVGGGRTATPLLEDLVARPFVEVVGIADLDPDCPGAQIAARNHIPFTTDAASFAKKGDAVDVLIETTGDPRVKRSLKMVLIGEGNRHTIIVHDLIARMMLSMSQDSDTLMNTFHPHDRGVGDA